MTSKNRLLLSLLSLAVIAGLLLFAFHNNWWGTGNPSETALVKVRFGMLPYGDHSYAIIGAKQGWFRDVGIDLQYTPEKIEDVVPFVKNGSLDMTSVPPGVIMAAYESNPGVVSFVFGDVFQGYAIMAQPGKGYKSVDEFEAQGMSVSDALHATVQQIRGHVFAYPAEAAIKPFIDLALQKGNLPKSGFKPLVLDDPLTVNAMRNHQADFEVGGVPSHIVLEREGYKPILTSKDLARAAIPSPDSPELASIFTDGWACSRQYYEQNRDTVLRVASVNFRITKFIQDHPDQALAIHMPYLTQITGQPFSAAEGKVIYNTLDPFYTFEQQQVWYHDPSSIYYYKNLNGAILKSYVAQGIYKTRVPSLEDVSVAYDVYSRLEALKGESDQLFVQINQLANPSPSVTAMIQQAHAFYDAYDFLDSARVAHQILDHPK